MSNQSNEFHIALCRGDHQRAAQLIKSHISTHGPQFLRIAVRDNYTAAAKLLLTSGCSIKEDSGVSSDSLLHLAVRKGNAEIAELLLVKGVGVNVKNGSGKTGLIIAIENGFLHIVDVLLRFGARVNGEEEDDLTPLHVACQMDFKEIVNLLLMKGANINATTKRRNLTPLHIAVECGSLDVVNILLLHRALVDCGDENGRTALHIACQNNFEEIAHLLLMKGAATNMMKAVDDLTPLHTACRNNFRAIVNMLLLRGAHINAVTENQKLTPLHLAAEFASSDVVNILLINGAQVDCEDSNGRTALSIAVSRGELPIVETVLKFHPNIQNMNNRICIKTAFCGHGNDLDKIFSVLLEYGLSVSPEMANDTELFHAAVQKKSLKVVSDLLKYGADVNAIKPMRPKLESPWLRSAMSKQGPSMISSHSEDSSGKPPIFYSVKNIDFQLTHLLLNSGAHVKNFPEVLHEAVRRNFIEIIEPLLKNGADVNRVDAHGRTALHFTVLHEDVECYFQNVSATDTDTDDVRAKLETAQLLLSKGANVDAQTDTGVTTLHVCVKKGLDSLVDLLMVFKANVALEDREKVTPLHTSAGLGNVDVCTKLLRKGAKIDAKNRDGNTALHLAVLKGHERVLRLLLDRGAQVNCNDDYDWTPLHMAADKIYPEIVIALLTNGANVNSRCKDGRTALHFSSWRNDPRTVGILLEYGADINITANKQSQSGYTPLDFAWVAYRHISRDHNSIYHNGYENVGITDTVDVLIEHRIKMMVAGLTVREPVLTIGRCDEFTDFYSDCRLEIDRMKTEFISDTNVSYYDILKKDTRFLEKYMNNEDVVLTSELEEYKENFPIYAVMIKSQFRKGLAKVKLLEPASQALVRFTKLPEDCVERILDGLTDDDLRVFTNVVLRAKTDKGR